jgi:hypothetical protein
MKPKLNRPVRRKPGTGFSLPAAVLPLALLLAATTLRASPRGQAHQALGSLSAAGNVYINGKLAPPESTIFSGDAVLTSGSGTATFAMSGKGSIKLALNTHIVFAGDPRYLAELTSGSAVLTSFAGATELSLKAGNFVVSPVVQTEQSSTKIEKTDVGAFDVTCLDGSVGVIPLEGVTGQVLRTGQTIEISPGGELGTPQEASSSAPVTQPTVKKKKRATWIILAAGGGGAAAAAAAIAASGVRGHPVSPSSM